MCFGRYQGNLLNKRVVAIGTDYRKSICCRFSHFFLQFLTCQIDNVFGHNAICRVFASCNTYKSGCWTINCMFAREFGCRSIGLSRDQRPKSRVDTNDVLELKLRFENPICLGKDVINIVAICQRLIAVASVFGVSGSDNPFIFPRNDKKYGYGSF